jgi:glycosyltransferase involved in cell wall biosynthesis
MALRFSIITVCFNAGATIGRTLASVAAQDHGEVEHLIVDGGSRDDTLAVVARGLRHGGSMESGPDTGIYNAMNKGLARATGDVVAFLNADDHYAAPDVLSRVAGALTSSGADALFGDVGMFDPATPDRTVRRYRSASFRPSRLRWGVMPAHPATFVRRGVFAEVGGFREDYVIAADFEMAIRMFANGRHSYVHLPDILVRMATGGVSTRGWRAAATINRESVRACRANGLATNQAMIMTKYARKLLEMR